MSKIIRCKKVNPSSGCDFLMRGKNNKEVLEKAKTHIKEHGLDPTPEIMKKAKSFIEDDKK